MYACIQCIAGIAIITAPTSIVQKAHAIHANATDWQEAFTGKGSMRVCKYACKTEEESSYELHLKTEAVSSGPQVQVSKDRVVCCFIDNFVV
jgi:hypothetical protein